MTFLFEPKRYVIEAQWGGQHNGGWVTVGASDDWDKTVERANFWDERVDVRVYDFLALPWRQQLAFKFNALDAYIRAGARPPRRPYQWWTEVAAIESIRQECR